ncbi:MULTISPECIES: Lrp/AsnC family transcriptional regulator [unclassified Moraxella]|uniref:Lrp/AsnC family transcriptional regulator n=1 Tax=unclassified Moraxella TaxID=2685852 RepID=UPI003AF8A2BB
MQHEIDDIDKRILNILQEDATLPLKNIAEQVHASVATCQRRIQYLMDSGVITKQVAIVNPKQLGYDLTAFVLIEMEKQNNSMQDGFERLMNRLPNVMSCYEISGDFDFLLLVHSKNMSDYHQFTRDHLTYENNVRRFKSQFVMNFAKVGTKISL